MKWTAALRSWTDDTPFPLKTGYFIATGASFRRHRHTRATFFSSLQRLIARPHIDRELAPPDTGQSTPSGPAVQTVSMSL